MRMYDIIDKKRQGMALSDKEIKYVAKNCFTGEIPDYQLSAWLMAVCIQGMDENETISLTKAMRDSGDKSDLSVFDGLSVDKHSTGGVGDKTSLIIAPIVASCGAKVAKMSGRGLGHTGGTVDKLEAINGFNTSLSTNEFINQVKKVGVAIVGQSGNFAPADKKLYSLRDVTATIQSIPLIASSIMSKKLAAGSDSIVLDVKFGSGAFMKTPESAKELAKTMVQIGKACDKKICALITNMDVPLGFAIGNSIEVLEALNVLKGKTDTPDLSEVCINLAANMLFLCFGITLQEAKKQAINAIESGNALNKFKEWIKAQGGDVSFIDNPSLIFAPKFTVDVFSKNEGYISCMDTEAIGKTACLLGAGREKANEKIDFNAGINLCKKTGDYVKCGEKIATLYSSEKKDFDYITEYFLSTLKFSGNEVTPLPLIYDEIR